MCVIEITKEEAFIMLSLTESMLKITNSNLSARKTKKIWRDVEKVKNYVDDLRGRLAKAEAKVKELTDELEKQKASAFETGELALKRGFEIERLEKENAELKKRLDKSEVK